MNSDNPPGAPTLPPIRQTAQDYRAHGLGFLDQLPRYAGIADVGRIGLAVDDCASLIMRLAAVKRQCVFIAAARIPGTPELELKAALAKWMWEDATHYAALETRLTELRSNKAAIDKVLAYQLGDFLGEILHSASSLELCVGYFDVLAPAYCAALRTYMAETQPLVDAPSVRLLRGILIEEEERLELGRQFVNTLERQSGGAPARATWAQHLQAFLVMAGGILGRDKPPADFARPAPRAEEAFRPTHEFARDERFTVMIPKVFPAALEDNGLNRMKWTRSQELGVAETVAVILYEWDDLPTEAIVDIARHCWDEVRHSLFGQYALESSGVDFHQVESWVGFGGHALSESPQKAMAHLSLAIEAGAMAHPGGKRGEWEFCRDVAHDPLMTTFQDFDWADEITHVKYGRKWVIEHHFKGNREAARKMADDSVRDRVVYYAKYGVRDWMADRIENNGGRTAVNGY